MSSKRSLQGAEEGAKRRDALARAEGGAVEEDQFGDDIEEEIIGGEAMEEDEDEGDGAAETRAQPQLFRPGVDKLAEDEQLEYDNSAYMMLHQLKVEFPFLSFDFVVDTLGEHRIKFPKTAFVVAGTQADAADKHSLTLLRMSDMHRTRKDRLEDDPDESDDSEDEDLDDDPVVDSRKIKHTGAVNRVRSMPQHPNIVASWSDAGRVYMWDLRGPLSSLGAISKGPVAAVAAAAVRPTFAFKGHKDEGFALDWSPVKAGRLATGDCKRDIYVWQVQPDGGCAVDDTPFLGHGDSVEDIQWSPREECVFASCSVDQSIRVWDVRQGKKAMRSIAGAHDQDVNVMSWNAKVPYLLASGSDDGAIKVWDLRMLKKQQQPAPVGHFRWHQAPVTSIQWHPHDDTVLVAAGADDQITVWDLGLEEDREQAGPKLQADVVGSAGERLDIPPQLLFVHQGQRDVKEVRFHPQVPGMLGSTAADGFHAWIPEPLDPKGIEKYLAPTTK